jgi:hypothetical protein
MNPTHLHVKAGVRYWEDATVNGEEDTDGSFIPFRNEDYQPINKPYLLDINGASVNIIDIL